jgi:type IX secretion system PorP/SprF family membrane protein
MIINNIKTMKYGLILLSLVVISTASAQQEQMYTHYDFNSMAMNPGYTGSKRTLVANALSRTQWTELPGAPRYQNFAVHSPLVNDFAVGLNFQTGKIGKFQTASPFSETQIAGNIAYHKQLANDLTLSVGLRLGVYNYKAELSKIRLNNGNDIGFVNNDYSISSPMTGFGAYLYSTKYFVGVSAPRMVFVNPDVRANYNVEYAAQVHYYLTGGVVLDAGTDLKIKPTTQIKFTDGAPVLADFNVHAIYKDKFSLGAFYRTSNTAGIMANAIANDNFTIFYSFDTVLGDIGQYVRGSHEIGVQFMVPYYENSKVRVPRYF